ncbi:MAG: Gfo/Idh/MocA family oxidoreductase [Rhodospirillaceae bacterium]
MSLHAQLRIREAAGDPIRVGMIGAGKFGSMYLAQVLRTPGVHLMGVVDLDLERARANFARVGWPAEQYAAASLDAAVQRGTTHLGSDWQTLVSHPAVDVIVECTGHPISAVDHCLFAFEHGKKVVNVTVEAEAFCGPLLAHKAEEAGTLVSLAYGDQPALACELVDWARTCGFPVAAAGRGHKWQAHFRESTPDTVWDHWGLTAEQAQRGGLNPKMFNAFLDGSKPAIESAAIANATGLKAPTDGLAFPPGGIDDIPTLMRPQSEGGVLEDKGMVEAVSSLREDGTPIPYDIRKGVWVCIEADTEYVKNCFAEYMVVTDPDGRYMSLYKRWHMIGLELGMSVASLAIRNETTGNATGFNADVVATAKRDLKAGEILDGEGGFTVFGKLMPAAKSVAVGLLPLGLAHDLKLVRDVGKDQSLTWEDVAVDTTLAAYQLRREMEALYDPARAAAE